MAKNNTKKTNGEAADGDYKPIDLKLPEGEWWRPWEDGDTTIEVQLQRVRKGDFGEYFIAKDGEGLTWFINIHAMLEGLKNYLGRVVKIDYLGKDQNRGRNGVHMYSADLVTRRRAASPARPKRGSAEGETDVIE